MVNRKDFRPSDRQSKGISLKDRELINKNKKYNFERKFGESVSTIKLDSYKNYNFEVEKDYDEHKIRYYIVRKGLINNDVEGFDNKKSALKVWKQIKGD